LPGGDLLLLFQALQLAWRDASTAPGKPLVLIVGIHQRSSWERVGREAAAWLIRPVSIGDVVAAVERLIGR